MAQTIPPCGTVKVPWSKMAAEQAAKSRIDKPYRWLVQWSPVFGTGVAEILGCKGWQTYTVVRLDGDDGRLVGYRMAYLDGKGESYDLEADERGLPCSCECKDHLYRAGRRVSPCKHVQALTNLLVESRREE